MHLEDKTNKGSLVPYRFLNILEMIMPKVYNISQMYGVSGAQDSHLLTCYRAISKVNVTE